MTLSPTNWSDTNHICTSNIVQSFNKFIECLYAYSIQRYLIQGRIIVSCLCQFVEVLPGFISINKSSLWIKKSWTFQVARLLCSYFLWFNWTYHHLNFASEFYPYLYAFQVVVGTAWIKRQPLDMGTAEMDVARWDFYLFLFIDYSHFSDIIAFLTLHAAIWVALTAITCQLPCAKLSSRGRYEVLSSSGTFQLSHW